MSKPVFNDTANGGANVTLDIGFSKDSDWNAKVVFAIQHSPGALTDTVQTGGKNSQIRKVESITKSRTIKLNLEAMKGHVVVFTDQRGITANAFISDIQFEEVNDITNLPISASVGTYKWTAELIKR